jgi:hypothetical protein
MWYILSIKIDSAEEETSGGFVFVFGPSILLLIDWQWKLGTGREALSKSQ